MVLTTWLRREVLLRGQEQIHHQLDDFARREVLAGLFVRLLGADPDELLEDVAHLHVVDALGREIDVGEGLDHFIEQILLRHSRDLLIEREPLHDLTNVLRKSVNVAVQIRRKLIRIVEQLG